MTTESASYAARLEVDYPGKLDRFTTFFRLIWVMSIAIVYSALSATATTTTRVITESGQVVKEVTTSGGGIAGALFLATMLVIAVRAFRAGGSISPGSSPAPGHGSARMWLC